MSIKKEQEIKGDFVGVKLYTLDTVEKETGIGYRTLLKYVNEGRLKAVKVGGRWNITEENLRNFLSGN